MSKYDEFNYQDNSLTLEHQLMNGESVLWKAKPEKKAFIFNKCCTMLPFALLWLAFDATFIMAMFSTGSFSIVFVLFFAFHLMPVWIWMSNVLTAKKHWENTEYLITNRRILIKNGFFTQNVSNIYYKDVQSVNVRVGIIDNMLKVGDIIISVNGTNVLILDIKEPHVVLNKLQQIVLDIQTDIQYPNEFRPSSNPGYQTQYTTKDE